MSLCGWQDVKLQELSNLFPATRLNKNNIIDTKKDTVLNSIIKENQVQGIIGSLPTEMECSTAEIILTNPPQIG